MSFVKKKKKLWKKVSEAAEVRKEEERSEE